MRGVIVLGVLVGALGTAPAAFAAIDASVVKTAPANVTAGNNLSYTITVSNLSAGAGSVSLADALPAGTTFLSFVERAGDPVPTVTSTPAVGSGGNVGASWSSLAGGATAVFTLTVKVIPSLVTMSGLNNTATVTSSGDPVPGNNSSMVNTQVNTSADLAITATDTPDPVAAGPPNQITYKLTVNNAGPSDAQNLTLSDVVPSGTTFSSFAETSSLGGFSVAFSPSTGTVTATRPTFAAGATAMFNLKVNVGASPPAATIDNAASVSSTTFDPVASNDNAPSTTSVLHSDLATTVTDAPDPVLPGGTITYDIDLANNGTAAATNATLTDAVPANTTFVSVGQTAGPVFAVAPPPVGGTGNVVASNSSMSPGATAHFQLVVRVSPAFVGPVGDTATATTSTFDTPAANNAATASTAVVNPPVTSGGGVVSTSNSGVTAGVATVAGVGLVPPPLVPRVDLALKGKAKAGRRSAKVTLTVTNTGNTAATGVVLTDKLPRGLKPRKATVAGGRCTIKRQTVTCRIASIGAGGVVNVAIKGSGKPKGTSTASVLTGQEANPSDNGARVALGKSKKA